MRKPYARQKKKARTGGEKGRPLRPRLVQKIAEGIKPPIIYELPGRLESKSDDFFLFFYKTASHMSPSPFVAGVTPFVAAPLAITGGHS